MLSAILGLTIVALLIATASCLAVYRLERRKLSGFVRGLLGRAVSPEEAVFVLARFIFSRVTRNRDPVFLAPILRSFGGSPLGIARGGGCCSGTHRLFIACLETIGIRAAQVTLYHHSGRWCHCIVQVSVNDREHLIDVDYGVQYFSPSGEPINLMHLRSGIQPSIRIFAEGLRAPLCKGYDRNPAPGYPQSDYYNFEFKDTRTANWTKSRIRKQIYFLLRIMTWGRIDCALVPAELEWPQMILALCLSGTALLLLALRAALNV